MFAKNILLGVLSLGALATAIPVDTASTEAAVAAVAPVASAEAVAAAPPPPPPNRPRPGQGQSGPPGRPREQPRPRPEGPRPGNGGRPGYDNGPRPGWSNNGPRPGYDNGPGWPGLIPVIPLGGLGYDSPADLERYCESLNIPTYQLPGECTRFCFDTAKGPWWC